MKRAPQPSFEWLSCDCPQCGAAVDLALPIGCCPDGADPELPCPWCKERMSIEDRWPATPSGHGSRGDGGIPKMIADYWTLRRALALVTHGTPPEEIRASSIIDPRDWTILEDLHDRMRDECRSTKRIADAITAFLQWCDGHVAEVKDHLGASLKQSGEWDAALGDLRQALTEADKE